jgi:hypothetical protein
VDSAGVPLPIYDPATTSPNPNFKPAEPVTTENLQYNRLPFAGNQVPTTRIDRKAHEALQFYPAPNSDAGPFFRNNLFTVAPETSKADGLIARVDHSVRERHRLGFGLNYSNGFDGAAPLLPQHRQPRHSQSRPAVAPRHCRARLHRFGAQR